MPIRDIQNIHKLMKKHHIEVTAKSKATSIARAYKNKADSDPNECHKVVYGSIIAMGSFTEGPIGEYMRDQNNADTLAKWACSEVNK